MAMDKFKFGRKAQALVDRLLAGEELSRNEQDRLREDVQRALTNIRDNLFVPDAAARAAAREAQAMTGPVVDALEKLHFACLAKD